MIIIKITNQDGTQTTLRLPEGVETDVKAEPGAKVEITQVNDPPRNTPTSKKPPTNASKPPAALPAATTPPPSKAQIHGPLALPTSPRAHQIAQERAFSSSLEFNADGWVDVPFAFDGSHPLTVEAWVTPLGLGPGGVAHVGRSPDYLEPTDQCGVTLEYKYQEGKIRWVAKAATAEGGPVRSVELVALGDACHAALVFNGQSYSLFVNGRLQESRELPAKLAPRFDRFRLGGHHEHKPSFRGRLHAFRMSRSARYAKDFQPSVQLATDKETLAWIPTASI